jgi:hypothetical protein
MHWSELVSGYFVLGVVKFALKTYPTPESKKGRWALGVAQYMAMNWDRAAEHFKPSNPPLEEPPNP